MILLFSVSSLKIFLNKALFVLSLRSLGAVGDKNSQGDTNKLWRVQIWREKKEKRMYSYSYPTVRRPWSVSVGNARPEMVLERSTRDKTEVDQNRVSLLQGIDRRVIPHCSGGNIKPPSEGLCTRKGILNIGEDRGGTGKSMRIS